MLKIQLSEPGSGIGAASSTAKGLGIDRWGEGMHVSECGITRNIVIGNYLDTNARAHRTWAIPQTAEVSTVRLTTPSGHDGRGAQRHFR